MANYAVPAPDDIQQPSSGYAVPAPDDVPSGNAGWQPTQYGFNVKPTTTFNGKPSVKRTDSAVWYGPEQGNTGIPGWFDAKGNRMGDTPGAEPAHTRVMAPTIDQSSPILGNPALRTQLNIATATPLMTGYGKVAGMMPDAVDRLMGGPQTRQDVANLNQWSDELAQGHEGLSLLPRTAGFMASTYPLSELATGVALGGKLVGTAGEALPSASKYIGDTVESLMPKATSYLGSLLNTAKTMFGVGLPAGATAALVTPTPQGESELEHINKTMLMSGGLSMLGATVPQAIMEAPGAARNAIANAKMVSGPKPSLPGEILTGETTHDIMSNLPAQFEGKTIPEIQRVSQGVGPDADAAKSLIQRLNVAGFKENGINYSLHDVSMDPAGRELEQSMEGGNRVNAHRELQGRQIRQSLMDHQNRLDNIAQAMPYDSESIGIDKPPTNRPLDPDIDDVHAMTPSINQAAEAGDKGAKYVKGLMDSADSNPKMIQASYQSEYWKNRQISNSNYNSFNDYIEQKSGGSPVDVASTISDLRSAIKKNLNSPSMDENLDALLNKRLENLTKPNVDLSYRGTRSAVSDMETEIEALKAQGKLPEARALLKIKNGLDNNITNHVQTVLADDPQALATFGKADKFYKSKVLPFQDPDSGISKLMNGVDADKSVKPFFTDSSPDEFERMFGLLDSKGRAAVRAEMVGRTEDAASRMKNFQDINLPSVARYLENRSDQVATAFGGDHSISNLANVIRNAPRAGYQSNLNKAISAGSIQNAIVKPSLTSIANRAAAVPITNTLEAMRYPTLFEPDLAKYARPIEAPPAPTPVPSRTAPIPVNYGQPTLVDRNGQPIPQPMGVGTPAISGGVGTTGSTIGPRSLVTPGMVPPPSYKPPVALGGPTAIEPRMPELAPYATTESGVRTFNPSLHPETAQKVRMAIRFKDNHPVGIAHPTTFEEYDALPSGTPYQSVSGAMGVKP